MEHVQAGGREPRSGVTRRAVMRGIGLGGVTAALVAAGWSIDAAAQDATPPVAGPNAVVIRYGRPDDPAAFTSYYRTSHIPLALTLPNVREIVSGPLLDQPGGGTSDDFWIATLHYASAADLRASLASDVGVRVLADVRHFATGGATISLAHLEFSSPADAIAPAG